MATYVIRDDKGLEEAYSKEDIDEMVVYTNEEPYNYTGD